MSKIPRTLAQNRKLSALVGDVARHFPLVPYSRAFAHEAWKRFLISQWVREARWEAYHAGAPDPFPVRPVPSSDLDHRQMSELIAFSESWAVMNGVPLRPFD